MACLPSTLLESEYEPGDRIIKDRFVKTSRFEVYEQGQALDPEQLHAPYVIWNPPGGPILVCGDDTLWRLTGLECLFLRAGITTLRKLSAEHDSADRKAG